MKYDNWTTEELLEERRQEKLNRMELDDYLGGKKDA